MNMNFTKLKKVFVMGAIIVAIMAVLAYILVIVYIDLAKLVTPLAHSLGIENVFGEITITIVVLLSILILIFITGYLILLPFFSGFRNKLEDFLINIYPPLNYLKVLTDEQLQLNSERANWKPVLALVDGKYCPAFIVEENDEWVTLSIVNVPNSDPIQLSIVEKKSIQFLPVAMKQMLKMNSAFGRGYLSMISSSLSSKD